MPDVRFTVETPEVNPVFIDQLAQVARTSRPAPVTRAGSVVSIVAATGAAVLIMAGGAWATLGSPMHSDDPAPTSTTSLSGSPESPGETRGSGSVSPEPSGLPGAPSSSSEERAPQEHLEKAPGRIAGPPEQPPVAPPGNPSPGTDPQPEKGKDGDRRPSDLPRGTGRPDHVPNKLAPGKEPGGKALGQREQGRGAAVTPPGAATAEGVAPRRG